MTINDLLDSEYFLVVVLVAVAIGMIVKMRLYHKATENCDVFGMNETGPVITAKATVIRKETINAVDWAEFRLENGIYLRLAIKEWRYFTLMLEGDVGLLQYVGKRFVGFKKDRKED